MAPVSDIKLIRTDDMHFIFQKGNKDVYKFTLIDYGEKVRETTCPRYVKNPSFKRREKTKCHKICQLHLQLARPPPHTDRPGAFR